MVRDVKFGDRVARGIGWSRALTYHPVDAGAWNSVVILAVPLDRDIGDTSDATGLSFCKTANSRGSARAGDSANGFLEAPCAAA